MCLSLMVILKLLWGLRIYSPGNNGLGRGDNVQSLKIKSLPYLTDAFEMGRREEHAFFAHPLAEKYQTLL